MRAIRGLTLSIACASGCFSDATPVEDSTTSPTTGGDDDDGTSLPADATSSPATLTTFADDDADGTVGDDSPPDDETSTTATTDPIDTTTDGEPRGHVVFVSSQTFRGNLMGLAGADAQCEFLASLSPLESGQTWVAMLADSGTAIISRVTITGPVRNVLGDVIAKDAAAFWNEQLDAALLTEYGEQPPTWDRARGWAVTWAATPDFSCQDWTNDTAAALGDVAVTLPELWIYGGGADQSCSTESSILCISQ